MALTPGDVVRLEMTKWRDQPHWQMGAVFLGRDDAGTWLGFPTGTHMARPGMEVTTSNDQVCLVPAASAMGHAWLATFHGPGGSVWTYVDMTTVPEWHGRTVRAVDLDLDVVKGLDEVAYVDDQDEFDEHRVELGYPREIVDLALATRDLVLIAVRDQLWPFDGHSGRWLEALRAHTRTVGPR